MGYIVFLIVGFPSVNSSSSKIPSEIELSLSRSSENMTYDI